MVPTLFMTIRKAQLASKFEPQTDHSCNHFAGQLSPSKKQVTIKVGIAN